MYLGLFIFVSILHIYTYLKQRAEERYSINEDHMHKYKTKVLGILEKHCFFLLSFCYGLCALSVQKSFAFEFDNYYLCVLNQIQLVFIRNS